MNRQLNQTVMHHNLLVSETSENESYCIYYIWLLHFRVVSNFEDRHFFSVFKFSLVTHQTLTQTTGSLKFNVCMKFFACMQFLLATAQNIHND